MPTTSINELCDILQQLLIEDANQLGRESGFIQRERKFNGSSFAQSLIFGWQANPQASLEDLCQSASVCGVQISPQGLQERLNSPQAHHFLHQLLLKGLTYLVQWQSERDDLLGAFNGVYLQDSSRIDLPACLHTLWQGNQQAQATLKIHTVLDYQHGVFDLTLANGRAHDCPLQTTALPAGSLRLADLGYFKVNVFKPLDEHGIYWVSRLPARAGIWHDGQLIHAVHWLARQAADCVDQTIELTTQRLHCRMVAIRVPADVAAERRRRVREAAKARKKHQLKSDTLALCDWTILLTNLPPAQFSPDDLLTLQRIRWQIELLFKLWKTDLSMDHWRSQQPHQILSEVYTKLLLALIQHWLLLLGCWHQHNRSLVKATHALRKHAFHILAALPFIHHLRRTLATILPTLARCTISKRKTRPASFQFLARAFP